MEDEKTQHYADADKEELFKSAMQGRWKDVAAIYARNEGVHRTKITWAGDTLLHLAVSSSEEKNVKLLMNCLIETNNEKYICQILDIQNDRGDTALHIAAALGMVGVCLDMAKLHPTMVVRNLNRRKETPLFKAVRHGQKKAFFALQSVVETHIKPPPRVTREGLRIEGGDTILHNAIFAEHFDLALEIINCYPVLVNAMNEKGESPLHVLANKPYICGSTQSQISKVQGDL
ncbi:putative E3 ubiquitin-protein ligase MIB1-like [Cocos nucifera]|uniref:Putative E3 ubiquitin-protein ligase MIB1-like n=1 Tax=Cocos nucifera TaxID=13894 RepID=A0A8K0IDA2_COCNU|nr:putative E3 ubiquitin-protein ligase MIB1-like [Cocos nucifera]